MPEPPPPSQPAVQSMTRKILVVGGAAVLVMILLMFHKTLKTSAPTLRPPVYSPENKTPILYRTDDGLSASLTS